MLHSRTCLTILLVLLVSMPALRAQSALTFEQQVDPFPLSLEEAIQIALINNYELRGDQLGVENAAAQVREAWGQVLPRVDVTSDYQRNLQTANPFAGSDAGGLFNTFGYIDWLTYNERTRTDNDPSTHPISFGEFQQRRMDGMQNAGITFRTSDNPFAVDNQISSGISISQTIYNGSAFAAIRGAERVRQINEVGSRRKMQVVVDQVRSAFYQALLAEEQARVVANSVERIDHTVNETIRLVAQGVASRYQQLSAEVERANLETQLIQAQNAADLAVDNLKLTIGMPVEAPVSLRGMLDMDAASGLIRLTSLEDAVSMATMNRPDLEQARIAIDLRSIEKEITRANLFPTLSAFANLSYIGRVPDYRTSLVSDPNDPFSFSSRENQFFSKSYWNPNVAVGLRLNWNVFNGMQTRSRLEQHEISVRRASLEYEQLEQGVRLDVERAMRNLAAARQRISSQEQNVRRAELNYHYAVTRLREGVSSQLEERQASELLDQSRMNFYQAVYDYLVAESNFETAVGAPLPPAVEETRLTLMRLDQYLIGMEN